MTRLKTLQETLEELKQEKRELIKPINKRIASVTQMIYKELKKLWKN